MEETKLPQRVCEFWFENFRRAVVIGLEGSSRGTCFLTSLDIYATVDDPSELGPVVAELSSEHAGVRLLYVDVTDKLSTLNVSQGELVLVETGSDREGGKRLEAVNVRVKFCIEDRSRLEDYVRQLYYASVRIFEGRDPEKEPLRVPKPAAKRPDSP
ncbi:MAG: hypothetical protein ABWW70_02260 [Thermoproteota archaeon]